MVDCKALPNALLGGRTGAVGYTFPTTAGSYSASVEARGAAVGIWAQNEGAAKLNARINISATQCDIGVFCVQTIASIRGVLEDCTRGAHLDSCSSARIQSLDCMGDGVAVYALGCHNLKVLNLSASARSADSEHQVQLVACFGYLLRDAAIHGGNLSALVLLGSRGDIQNTYVANSGAIDRKFSSASRSHSIYMNGCFASRLRQVTTSFGILAVDCHGDWDLVDCSVLDGGAILFPDTSDAGTLRVVRGEFNADALAEGASSATRQPRTAAALWAVPETLVVGECGWQYVDVDGVRAYKPTTANSPLTASVVSSSPTDFTSRFATIHVNATYEARVGNCTLTGVNSNVIIGDLTYIESSSEDASNYRFGPERVVANNNRFVGDYSSTNYHALLVMVGRDERCHEARDNVFHIGSDFNDYNDHAVSIESIRFYTEAQVSTTDWTRLIFTGNHGYRGDRFNEGSASHLDFMISFSANVLVDACLAVDVDIGWQQWEGWDGDERRTSVVAHNSIRPYSVAGDSYYIRSSGALTTDPP